EAIREVSVDPPATSTSVDPPAASTLPFGKSVAVWPVRGTRSGVVVFHSLEAGSYISVSDRVLLGRAKPPATSTRPFGSSVAVNPSRAAVVGDAVRRQVRCCESYSSVDERVTSFWPPV